MFLQTHFTLMNNKISDYFMKYPRSRLVCFISLVSNHEWNYEYENYNFLTKSFNIRFTEKTRNNFKRWPFVSLEELYSYSFCLPEREESICLVRRVLRIFWKGTMDSYTMRLFLLLVVFRERETKISFFGFSGKEFSPREISLSEKK